MQKLLPWKAWLWVASVRKTKPSNLWGGVSETTSSLMSVSFVVFRPVLGSRLYELLYWSFTFKFEWFVLIFTTITSKEVEFIMLLLTVYRILLAEIIQHKVLKMAIRKLSCKVRFLDRSYNRLACLWSVAEGR